MRSRPALAPPGRAILSVIALYALLLQAFLGALQPLPAAAAGILCEVHLSEDGSGAPADHGASCRDHACCLPARAVPMAALLPAAAPVPAPPTPRPVVRAGRPGTDPAPRAPPDRSTSPRGPPAA